MGIDRVKRALESVALAMEEGDRKYGENKWVPKEGAEMEPIIVDHAQAAKRHV